MDPNQIEKNVVLKAPLERVWRAISNSSEFGDWFGATIEGPFQKGFVAQGVISGTKVDPSVAAQQQPHVGQPFELYVLELEPQKLIAFTWYPYGCGPTEDSPGYATRVEFRLKQLEEGVELTITESGFENIPLEKRQTALEMNAHGWQEQTRLVRLYTEQNP